MPLPQRHNLRADLHVSDESLRISALENATINNRGMPVSEVLLSADEMLAWLRKGPAEEDDDR